ALFGGVAGVAGAWVSSLGSALSTGPVIVLCISLIVLISLTLAPNRGLLWNSLRQWRTRRRLRSDVVLENLYQMSSQHADPTHPHAVAALEAVSGSGAVRRSLQELQHRGLAAPHPNGQWALTSQGVALAQRQQQAAKPAEERRYD